MPHTEEDIRLMYEKIGELKSRLSECERERDAAVNCLDEIYKRIVEEHIRMPIPCLDAANEILAQFKQSLKSENNGNE